jgi:outer membrane protein assembly factor BamA
VRYGVQYTSEYDPVVDQSTRGPGLGAEARRRNVFGTAFGAGVGFTFDARNQSLRGAINIPSSVFWPAISTVFLKASRSLVEGGSVTEKEMQFTYQDRWRLGRRIEWSYGYSLSHNDRSGQSATFYADSQAVSGRRASLYSAIVRDSRDSPFNATRGAFLSASVEYGGSPLGSDVGYMRYLLQNSDYRKAGPLVLAGAARFGVLANVTGDVQQTYDLTFQTGGDREVRGYAEQSLYPPEVPGQPIGGRALLILNAEARFPVWGWLKGAVFADAGNAFTDLNAVSLHGLKVGTGLGLRLDTPYALFRVDFGIPLPQEAGLHGRWHFSIGQAF